VLNLVRFPPKMKERIKLWSLRFSETLHSPKRRGKDIRNSNTEKLNKFIRQRIRATYHYACTLRPATEDDFILWFEYDKARLYGVSGLKVCDTGAFSQKVSVHLQAPAVMVAERYID